MGLVLFPGFCCLRFKIASLGMRLCWLAWTTNFILCTKWISIHCIQNYTGYISIPSLSLVGGEPGYEATSCLTPLVNAYKDTYQHKTAHPVLVCNCLHKLKCRWWTGFCFLSHQPSTLFSTWLFHIFEPRPPLQRGKVRGGLGTSFTCHSKSFKAAKCL